MEMSWLLVKRTGVMLRIAQVKRDFAYWQLGVRDPMQKSETAVADFVSRMGRGGEAEAVVQQTASL